jgi:DNA-binding beta-propeller fold protein YncE
VTLHWEPLRLGRLAGLNLYRREASSQAFQLLPGSPLPADAGAAEDSAVTNGVTYEYILLPLIQDYGEGVASPVQVATPGPDFAVVCDGCDGIVTELSADMRSRVWTTGGFFYPLCVAAEGGRVWLADPYTGVYCLTDDGGFVWKNSESPLPVFLAVSREGLCAVVDAGESAVRVLSAEGLTLLTISDGLQRPSCVAFDADGNLWLADREASSVSKYSPGGVRLASFAGCPEPRFLDVDADESSCWVGDASTGELVKLNSQAEEAVRIRFSTSMSAVEADRAGGGCWVADAGKDVVARVASDGRVLFMVGKLGGPVALFATEDGRAWVLGADEPRVTVLSASGGLELAIGFGQCPTSIVVIGR